MGNRDDAVRMFLEGKPAGEIARDLKVSRARVYQLLREASEKGAYRVQVTVSAADGVPLDAVAGYLRRALKLAGVRTGTDS